MKKIFLSITTLIAAALVALGQAAVSGNGVKVISGTLENRSYTFKPSGNVSETTLAIANLFAEIVIEGVDGSEIKIETEDYEGIPEKAEGLKPLSASGPENTGVGLSLIQEGKIITVSAASRNANGEYSFKVPKSMMLKLDISSWQASSLVIKNMTNEVEVKGFSADLIFDNVTGPIVANTVSGEIKVSYNSLSQKSPSSITSTSGDVDITLPPSAKGNFKMSSISGEVYTDLDFKFAEEKDLNRFGGGMTANATLNGGGVEVSLKSVSGNIYIRKIK